MKDTALLQAEITATENKARMRGELRHSALAKLFGCTHHLRLVDGPRGLKRMTQGEALEPVPAFSSLPEAYVAYTGDSSFQRIAQAGTTDFPAALADVLDNLLLRDYADDLRWGDIVTERTNVDNFKTQQRARAGFVEDLPDVSEDEPYTEIPNHGDEGYTYGIGAKGGTLTFTRRMVVNDQVGAVRRLVEQAGRAAFRTLAKAVWAKVVDNATYGADAKAMFHADHGNFGTTALSVAGLNAARAALFAQKEPGSTERMGLNGPFLLVVPDELAEEAWILNSSERDPSEVTDFTANPWKGKFGANGERIFVNPLFTDADDWALFDVSGRVGIIEVGFLMGKQSPTIIVANNPTAGQTFSQDRITYRMAFEFAVEIADYRGAFKGVVGG